MDNVSASELLSWGQSSQQTYVPPITVVSITESPGSNVAHNGDPLLLVLLGNKCPMLTAVATLVDRRGFISGEVIASSGNWSVQNNWRIEMSVVQFWFEPVPIFSKRNRTKPHDPKHCLIPIKPERVGLEPLPFQPNTVMK